jgi:VWFA-related protein
VLLLKKPLLTGILVSPASNRCFSMAASLFRLRLLLLALPLFFCTAASVHAQEPDDVITTETSLVQLNVGVVDRQGHAVTSLSRSDFAVYEDNVKQSIQSFEPTDAPFSLVLLLDMSGSTVSFRQQLKTSAMRFLDALSPEDRLSIIQFNAKVKQLTPFGTDRKKAAYAIDIAQGVGETYFYEALRYSLSELAKEGKRRKAIVVLTDGLDTHMRNADRERAAGAQSEADAVAAIKPETSSELNSILSAADRQGVTIYPLALPSGDPKRLPLPDPTINGIYAAARMRLQTIADRTGGSLNEIRRLDQMSKIYLDVAASLRTLYTVAYQARADRPRDGKWHAIRIEVMNPDLTARTRPGYFAK